MAEAAGIRRVRGECPRGIGGSEARAPSHMCNHIYVRIYVIIMRVHAIRIPKQLAALLNQVLLRTSLLEGVRRE